MANDNAFGTCTRKPRMTKEASRTMDSKRKDAGAPKIPDHAERKIGNVIDAGLLELNSRLATHGVKANEIALDEIAEFSKIVVAEISDMANSWKKEKSNFTTRQAAMKECDDGLEKEFDNLFDCLAQSPVTVCEKTKWAVNHFEGKVRRDIKKMIRGWTYD
jgi:hypothetical protein